MSSGEPPFSGYLSLEGRQARYRGERSERNDDWTPQELVLNRAAHELAEARRALERAESELRVRIDEAVNVEGLALERVEALTALDEDQVLAQLAAIERRDRGLEQGARRGDPSLLLERPGEGG
jgi:hypothetical protein